MMTNADVFFAFGVSIFCVLWLVGVQWSLHIMSEKLSSIASNISIEMSRIADALEKNRKENGDD